DKEVDDCQAQVEHGDERLATGNRRRGHAILRKRGARLGHIGGTHIVERARFHGALPLAARAFATASDTRRGVSGTSSKLAPMVRNASATALAITAGGAMAPPSPAPLTPYSVPCAGVTALAMLTSGISAAPRTQYSPT